MVYVRRIINGQSYETWHDPSVKLISIEANPPQQATLIDTNV